ncbi:chromate transporter [Pseudomonas sp. CCI1.2]|uniref:chromate transporter n=1 Tax=unclassified Pseudomonas TaxID=196821 RepID=UPI002AC8D726|nr:MULTISPECIES: chromate transporter [unclassified Pseudomonas]MEB0092582.1 chromate transporter [Pseudomonas sp. CCI4.2]MEB0119170.1 chromate transporter [Pseudomonas sp. CCI1.2]WPX54896.1 chromate transporter [Pseudomonas sp. CCI4.2]
MQLPNPIRPTLWELFFNFAMVGLFGFGGVMPWARQMMVDRRQWVDDAEFAELLTTGQFFPGPNIGNICIIFGRRQQGLAGARVSIVGLYLFPTIVTILAGFAYTKWWHVYAVQQVFGAVMPIATGLMLGTTLRLLQGMPRNIHTLSVFVITFVFTGLLVLPLWTVLLICIPLSLALSYLTPDGRAHQGEA